jgi:hypothetical protein
LQEEKEQKAAEFRETFYRDLEQEKGRLEVQRKQERMQEKGRLEMERVQRMQERKQRVQEKMQEGTLINTKRRRRRGEMRANAGEITGTIPEKVVAESDSPETVSLEAASPEKVSPKKVDPSEASKSESREASESASESREASESESREASESESREASGSESREASALVVSEGNTELSEIDEKTSKALPAQSDMFAKLGLVSGQDRGGRTGDKMRRALKELSTQGEKRTLMNVS